MISLTSVHAQTMSPGVLNFEKEKGAEHRPKVVLLAGCFVGLFNMTPDPVPPWRTEGVLAVEPAGRMIPFLRRAGRGKR